MNILLVGEYSRLHNSLKEGLQKLGHHVVILGFQDGFKKYPVDLPLYHRWNSSILKKIRVGLFKLTGFDINSYFIYRQFKRYQKQLQGFDVVQLINEHCFYSNHRYEKKMLQYLFDHNKKTFLLCCGTDYLTVDFYFKHPNFKSLMWPYFEKKVNDREFESVLKFRKPQFRELHNFIQQNIQGMIASDLDYDLPLQGHPKYLGMVPNPVNTEKLPYIEMKIDDKIVIFHGINSQSYFKKGNDFFDQALEIIAQKYADQVEIVTTRDIPYQQYIEIYNRAHILLDMAYSFDQGYHALEAMAKGKVVFTGAETEFYQHYHLSEKVNINAKPDVDYLVQQLSFLIENPQEIITISHNARMFVEREHHYLKSAQRYLEFWNTKLA
ncbi:glycosyltransferase family 4 protein [Flavobacterium sp. CYK-4]|uniref:glycosyltransferase family protein n=1 Tax=Flavobacterium lotistagni TaxID=2709660 RepID=UPI001407C6C8|nr:glycosyltransferase [Flavobacterium lotistagni]NHM07019.1 glycosyltransferase family 4 protein [Flavobacterium lotistagni]